MAMTTEDFSQKLQGVLRRHLRFLEPGAALTADSALGALGLDSMAAVNLLVDLEEAFGVQIPDALLDAETFETLGSLESTFRPLLEPASARSRTP
jgi:acyl carrier protein